MTPTPEPSPTPAPVDSGETIPPISHPETRDPPLSAGPLPGVENPVLTPDDVTDFGDVTLVADPFLFVEDGEWHLFFEVYNEDRDPDAVIGHARSSGGRDWEYTGVVLEKDAHTSFPLVWKWEGEYYMCPPTGRNVELWRARSFPDDWELLGNLLEAEYYPHDPVIFRYEGRWWLFTDRGNDAVMAFHSEDLESTGWKPHAGNPVVTDRLKGARHAGRPVVVGDRPYLFRMDLRDEYGDKVRGYEVTELTTTTYADRELPESPVLSESGVGWNAEAMHHFDHWWDGDGWLCAVDGERGGSPEGRYAIGLYYVPADASPRQSSLPADRSRTAAYYTFDGHEGVAVDQRGSRLPGVVFDAEARSVGGVPGRTFAEDTSRVVFPYTYESALDGDAFSLVTYVRPATRGRKRTLLEYGKFDGETDLRVDRNGDASWTVTAAGRDGDVSFTADGGSDERTPVQVALTYARGSGFGFHTNGVERGRGGDPGSLVEYNDYLVLGADRRGESPWSGWIGPFGVYDVALTGPELDAMDAETRAE